MNTYKKPEGIKLADIKKAAVKKELNKSTDCTPDKFINNRSNKTAAYNKPKIKVEGKLLEKIKQGLKKKV